MTKQKSTKRALLFSALSLLVCISMLVGSTFAWFTDSVTSGKNKIVAGNLDVVLEYKNDVNGTWAPVDENTKIFDEDALYEPGYTEVVFLRVANAGTLALKYNLLVEILSEKTSTNVNGGELKLSDHLKIGTYLMDEYSSGANYADILFPFMFGTREAALSNVTLNKLSTIDSVVAADRPVKAGTESSQVMAIVLTMPETVGNEANYDSDFDAPEIELGISLLATQYTEEDDSFDNQYDKDAEYGVTNAAELKKALTDGGNVKIANDIKIDDTLDVSKETVIDLNGNNLDVKAINATADMAIVDSGEIVGKPVRYQDPATIIVDNGATVTLANVDVSTTDWGSYQEQDGVTGGEMFALYIKDGNVVMNGGDLIVKKPEQAAMYGSAYGLIIEGGSFTMNGGSIIAADGMANPFAIGVTVKDAADECVINLNDVDIQTKYMISLVGAGKCTVNLTNTPWDAKWTYKRYFSGTYVLNQN